MKKIFDNFRSFKSFKIFKAFTLVELMIVIAIIGILSAVLYPSITGYFERARDTAKKTELNNLNLAVQTFYIDNGSYRIGAKEKIGWIANPGRGWMNYSDGNYSETTIIQYLKKLGYLKGNYKIYGSKDWHKEIKNNSNSPCNASIRIKDGYWFATSMDGNRYSISAYLEKSSKNEDKEYLLSLAGGEYPYDYWLDPCRNYGRNYGIGN